MVSGGWLRRRPWTQQPPSPPGLRLTVRPTPNLPKIDVITAAQRCCARFFDCARRIAFRAGKSLMTQVGRDPIRAQFAGRQTADSHWPNLHQLLTSFAALLGLAKAPENRRLPRSGQTQRTGPAIVMSVIKTKEKELELNADSAPTLKPKGF